MTLRIRRYTPADEDALFSFRENLFPKGHKSLDRAHFRWKFLEHPYAGELPFFIMEDNDRIVGTQGYWPFVLSSGAKRIRCGHLVDFNVEEAYRGLPTLKLFKAVCSCSDINFGAYLSADARRFFSAAKWVDASSLLKNYYCFLKAPPESGLAGKAKLACRLAANGIRQQAVALRGGRCRLEVGDHLPPQVDALLSLANRREQPCFIKERNFLAWRYERSSRLKYRFGSLYQGDNLKGVAIFHVVGDWKMTRCFIMDIIHSPGDLLSVKMLLVKLIRHLTAIPDITVLQSSALPCMGQLFQSCGFSSNPSGSGLMLSQNYKHFLDKTDAKTKFNFILGDTDFL